MNLIYGFPIPVVDPFVKTGRVHKISLTRASEGQVEVEPVKDKLKLKWFCFTVKSVLSDHIKQGMFGFSGRWLLIVA